MELTMLNRGSGQSWRMIVNVLSTIVIVVALFADVFDLVGFLSNPEAYPIGSESAGVRYASRLHFLGATIGAIALYMIGVIGPMLTRQPARKIAIRMAIALWAIGSTAWFVLVRG